MAGVYDRVCRCLKHRPSAALLRTLPVAHTPCPSPITPSPFAMTQVLDLVEKVAHMQLGASAVQRIDSTTRSRARYAAIQGFKDPASPLLLFLMAVRSCGLGTDLPRVDVALLLDSDWHPLLDIQVMHKGSSGQLWVGWLWFAALKEVAHQPDCCCCNKLAWTRSLLLLCIIVYHRLFHCRCRRCGVPTASAARVSCAFCAWSPGAQRKRRRWSCWLALAPQPRTSSLPRPPSPPRRSGWIELRTGSRCGRRLGPGRSSACLRLWRGCWSRRFSGGCRCCWRGRRRQDAQQQRQARLLQPLTRQRGSRQRSKRTRTMQRRRPRLGPGVHLLPH